MSYGFPRAFTSESVSLAYGVTHLSKEAPFGGELDPNTPPPILPETGLLASLRAGWGYSSLERQAFDVSASGGYSLGLGLSLADPLIGSDFRTVTFTWSGAAFVENPWAEHHVLAMRYGGGISGGDFGRRGVFGVGGFRDASLLDAILDDVILGGVALRGYAPFSRAGTQFHLLQVEYRFPLWRTNRGLQTLPVYVNRMHANLFVDYGDAFFNDLDFSTFRAGAGAELLTNFTLGYFLNLTLRTGFAWGFHEAGGAQFYAHVGIPF